MSRKYARNPPATQIEAWKRALADHHKAQRNQRGRRPAPQITGIRIPAPRNDGDRGEQPGELQQPLSIQGMPS